jgi:Methyltransferase domain
MRHWYLAFPAAPGSAGAIGLGRGMPMFWRDVMAGEVTPLTEGDLDGAVRLLRSASSRELRDNAFLCEELLLRLGLNGEILEEFPRQLYPWCGHGIRSWQYPIQFARYLIYLSERNIGSYVEIGCRFGGTFIIVVEYLRRFGDLRVAAALDIGRAEIMAAYAKRTLGIDYRIANSRDPDSVAYLGSQTWDLAFIDGDHSYEGCSADFEAVKNHARRIALHDIASSACPGVVGLWSEIRRFVPAHRVFEATDQYRDVRERTGRRFLGIGVVDFS